MGADQSDSAHPYCGSMRGAAPSEPHRVRPVKREATRPKSHAQHAGLRARAGQSGSNLHTRMAKISKRIRYLPSRGSQILPWRVVPETAVY